MKTVGEIERQEIDDRSRKGKRRQIKLLDGREQIVCADAEALSKFDLRLLVVNW